MKGHVHALLQGGNKNEIVRKKNDEIKKINFFSTTDWLVTSTKLGRKHPRVNGIHFLKQGLFYSSKEDNLFSLNQRYGIIIIIYSFMQMSLMIETVSNVSDVAHNPLVCTQFSLFWFVFFWGGSILGGGIRGIIQTTFKIASQRPARPGVMGSYCYLNLREILIKVDI